MPYITEDHITAIVEQQDELAQTIKGSEEFHFFDAKNLICYHTGMRPESESFNLYCFRGYWDPIYERFPLNARLFQRLVQATDQENSINMLTVAGMVEYSTVRRRNKSIHNAVDAAYIDWLEQLFFSEKPEFLFMPITEVVSYAKDDTFEVEFYVAGLSGGEEARYLMAIIAQAITQNWPRCRFKIEEYRFRTIHEFISHVDHRKFEPILALPQRETGYQWNAVDGWQLSSDISYDEEYDPNADYDDNPMSRRNSIFDPHPSNVTVERRAKRVYQRLEKIVRKYAFNNQIDAHVGANSEFQCWEVEINFDLEEGGPPVSILIRWPFWEYTQTRPAFLKAESIKEHRLEPPHGWVIWGVPYFTEMDAPEDHPYHEFIDEIDEAVLGKTNISYRYTEWREGDG